MDNYYKKLIAFRNELSEPQRNLREYKAYEEIATKLGSIGNEVVVSKTNLNHLFRNLLF